MHVFNFCTQKYVAIEKLSIQHEFTSYIYTSFFQFSAVKLLMNININKIHVNDVKVSRLNQIQSIRIFIECIDKFVIINEFVVIFRSSLITRKN